MFLRLMLERLTPVQRTVGGRLAVETGLVAAVVAVATPVAAVLSRLQLVDNARIHYLFALLAAGVGLCSSGLGHTAGRLLGNRRAAWLIPALTFYSVDVVPDTAMPVGRPELVRPDLSLLVDWVVVAVLLVAAIRPPARLGGGTAWCIALAGVLSGFVLDGAGQRYPALESALVSPAALNLVVLFAWCSVSTAVAAAGYVTASPPLWRVGLGFGVIAVAHLQRALFSAEYVDPVFGFLRLFGVFVVALGMAQLLRRALAIVLNERFTHQEELRVSAIRAEEVVRFATERQHELRNGLFGLAGVTQLLGRGVDDLSSGRARSAAVTELLRLRELVDGRDRASTEELYCAGEIVEQLVALWRLNGMDIATTVPASLMAVGSPSVLAQVLTNLLTNCAQHAPGAPVRIVATSAAGHVRIQLRNEAAGERAHTGPTAGRGIGLELSRRLLRDQGGDLTVQPGDGRWPGFTVTVELVAGSPLTASDRIASSDDRTAPRRSRYGPIERRMADVRVVHE
jgi:two-component system OmpR family sensor kinase